MAHIFKRTTVKQKVAELKVKDFDKKLAIIQEWYKAYQDGSLQKRTEGQCEQAFNDDIFKKVLGYIEYPSQPHTIIPQLSPEKGGQRADAGLGYFDEKRQRVFAVVEIKDVNKKLDRSQQREGNLSPIQQAFKYKPLFKDCRFVIATNFYEIRLFQDNQLDYEQFTLKSLCDPANDYFELKKFILLLSAENFVSGRGKSKTEELLAEIRIEQEKISKEFYNEYSKLRLEIMRDIWKNNKDKRDIHLVTDMSQKLLDRIVFVSFCEDTGLLPDNTLHKVFQHSESNFSSVWDTLKGFFRAVDSGSDKLGIPKGYNGGLFHEDRTLDELKISDDALKALGRLGRYDFENELTVNILGHVFEQSISDLEEIKQKVDPDEASKKSKRKKDGIFYTPEYIVDYIVQNSLGKYLRENEEQIFEKHQLSKARTEKTYRERELKALQEYQDFLHTVKVVDPACGSGAFLVKVFDYLLEENRRVGELIGGLFSQDQVYKDILRNNIYGVDLNEESVRITQLSLWLKTAQRGKKLTYLDKNIRVGNSLIDDPKIAGSKAFNWQEEFKEVFDKGGFDVVVGNPPYVSNKMMHKSDMQNAITYWNNKFISSKSGNYDLYIIFIELSLLILKSQGILGFIIPNKLLLASYSDNLLDLINDEYCFMKIGDFSKINVFKDASVYPINIFIKNKKKNKPTGIVKRDIYTFDTSLNLTISDNWNFIDKVKKYKDNSLISRIIHKIESVDTCNDNLNFQPGINGFQFKNYGECIREGKDSKTAKRIIVTGSIDPFVLLKKPTKYRGTIYIDPYIHNNPDIISEGKWELFSSPKVMIAGMTKRIEAIIDENGTLAPAVSVYNILSNEIDLYFILALLNSKLVNWYFSERFSDKHLSGGYISINNKLLKQIPFAKEQSKEIANKCMKLVNVHESLQEEINNSLKFIKSQTNQDSVNEDIFNQEWNTISINLKVNDVLDVERSEKLFLWVEKKKKLLSEMRNEINQLNLEVEELITKLYGLNQTESDFILNI